MMTRIVLGIAVALAISFPGQAQQYPAKPIKIVVPFPVGGIADLYARLIGNRWTEAWGQPVVVENRTGAGTASHLAGELFKTMAKVDMVHIPYKGNVPAITDLLAGQTSLLFGTMPTVLPHAKAGKLRALATIGASRAAASPETPTVAESLPDFEVTNWVGLFAPAGTPPEITGRLNGEVQKCMQSKEIAARLAAEGARFIPMTPEQFGNFVKAEIAKWAPVVKASGARAD